MIDIQPLKQEIGILSTDMTDQMTRPYHSINVLIQMVYWREQWGQTFCILWRTKWSILKLFIQMAILGE